MEKRAVTIGVVLFLVFGGFVYAFFRSQRQRPPSRAVESQPETFKDEHERWNDLVLQNAKDAGLAGEVAFPESSDAYVLQNYLARYPGPAPWALDTRSLRVGPEVWRWSHDQASAATVLRDPSGQARIAVGFDVVAMPIATDKVLLYTTVGDDAPSGLALALVDLAKSSALADASIKSLGRASPWIVTHDAIVASSLVPVSLPAGEHLFEFPAAFRSIGGCPVAVGDRVVNGKQRRYRYLLDFETNRVTVDDLAWFNDGSWDFGYQWISRIAPTPDKKSYVAEVVRGGLAELRPDGKSVLRWIVVHPFWMPMPPPVETTAN